MAYWDTSTLLKLYLAEPDSARFEALAIASPLPPMLSLIARHEACAAFLRREGVLPPGEAETHRVRAGLAIIYGIWRS